MNTTATATAANGTKGRTITVTHQGATMDVNRKSAAWVAVGTGNAYHPSGLFVRVSNSEASIRKVAAELGCTVVEVQDPA